MATVRAKFRCNSITGHAGMSAKTVKFAAVYDSSIPEDRRYATATPTGELTMLVDNPAVSFELGRQYYLDFTPAE
jgi:hypothetical protein